MANPKSPTEENATTGSHLPSPFAAFKKATDLIGHYVDFSDSSSVVSSGSTDHEPTSSVTDTSKHNLQVPLLADGTGHDIAVAASDGPDTPAQSVADSVSGSPTSYSELQTVAAEQTPNVEVRAQSLTSEPSTEAVTSPESSDSANVVDMYPEVPQAPSQLLADEAATSDSSDGAQTPTQQDIRASHLQSQPVDEDILPSAATSSGQPQPASSDLDRMGSGILNPSLLTPLLSNHPLPEASHQSELYVPHEPDAHISDVEAAGQPADKSQGSGWILTTCVMVAEMFGLGILTLPADFARLGWAVGLAIVLLFCLGMIYSGVLFAQLGRRLPNARVYEDLASASLGKHGKWLVYCTVYLVILLDPIIFHLTAAQSLQQIFYEKNVPMWVASLTVSVIMLPLSQIQHIGEVSLISIVGTVGMLTAVVIATLKLMMMEVKVAEHEAVHSGGFNVAVVALMDIVFTFGGQQNWMRYIGGMRKKSDFRYSATVGSLFMTTFYVILGGVGYWKMGYHFDHSKPVTSVLPTDMWTAVMNIGLFAHCIIAYQIDLNVWTDLILDFTARRSRAVNKSPRQQRFLWLVVSIIGIAFAAVMAYLLPFFSTIMGLIAAIGDLSAAYALPALFCLCLMRKEMPKWEQALCYLLVPLSVVLSAFGVYASVVQLIREAGGKL